MFLWWWWWRWSIYETIRNNKLPNYRYSPLTGELLANTMISGNTINGSGWCIFVYNLAPETEENVLWQLFGPFGEWPQIKFNLFCISNLINTHFLFSFPYFNWTGAVQSVKVSIEQICFLMFSYLVLKAKPSVNLYIIVFLKLFLFLVIVKQR